MGAELEYLECPADKMPKRCAHVDVRSSSVWSLLLHFPRGFWDKIVVVNN